MAFILFIYISIVVIIVFCFVVALDVTAVTDYVVVVIINVAGVLWDYFCGKFCGCK